jgi:hypothetical protein
MQKGQRKPRMIRKGVNKAIRNELWRVSRHEFWNVLTSGVVAIGWSLFALSLSYYVFKTKSASSDISNHQALTYFAFGISAFVIVIAGVAGFVRHLNRDVVLLKTRLAGIYLSALKNSALNPEPKSTSSHD